MLLFVFLLFQPFFVSSLCPCSYFLTPFCFVFPCVFLCGCLMHVTVCLSSCYFNPFFCFIFMSVFLLLKPFISSFCMSCCVVVRLSNACYCLSPCYFYQFLFHLSVYVPTFHPFLFRLSVCLVVWLFNVILLFVFLLFQPHFFVRSLCLCSCFFTHIYIKCLSVLWLWLCKPCCCLVSIFPARVYVCESFIFLPLSLRRNQNKFVSLFPFSISHLA